MPNMIEHCVDFAFEDNTDGDIEKFTTCVYDGCGADELARGVLKRYIEMYCEEPEERWGAKGMPFQTLFQWSEKLEMWVMVVQGYFNGSS